MNDWWDYLEHGQEGQERKGHKYYARVPVGKNKFGFTKYRYFYDAREYGAYMANQKNGKGNLQTQKTKGYTTYVTGRGSQMLPSSIAKEDVERLRGTGVATTHKMTNEKGEWTGASAVGRAKTVKDYGKSLRNGKEKVKKLLRKASKAHNENRYTDTLHIAVGTDYMYREQKNRINGRTRSKTYEGKGVANDFERTTREWKKNEENNKKYEPIYQAHKAYHKASVATKKGALTVKRLLKKWSSKK